VAHPGVRPALITIGLSILSIAPLHR
jgi:hypothetical protein